MLKIRAEGLTHTARLRFAEGKRTEGAMLLEDLSRSEDVDALRSALQVAIEELKKVGDVHGRRGHPEYDRATDECSAARIWKSEAPKVEYAVALVALYVSAGKPVGIQSLELLATHFGAVFDDEPDHLGQTELIQWREERLAADPELAAAALSLLLPLAGRFVKEHGYGNIANQAWRTQLKLRIAKKWGLSETAKKKLTWNCRA